MNKKLLIINVLAIIYLFFALPLFSLSQSEIKALHVVPQSTTFFTGRECCYTLAMPGLSPSQVQTEVPALPDTVQFLSSKRDEYVNDNGERGTVVKLWFSFSESGNVQLPPLNVTVDGRIYHLAFDAVTVFADPETLSPVVFVKFDDNIKVSGGSRSGNESAPASVSISAGQKIRFTLYLKYAVQVVDFSWELPKNSLFTELERYSITKGEPRGNDFSPDAIPVARFEWEPLVAGHWNLPVMHLTATSYSGVRKDPVLPAYDIIVSESLQQSSAPVVAAPQADARFDYAFAGTPETSSVGQTMNGSVDSAQLARLRSSERHSFPWSRAASKRVAAEAAAGITSAASEPSLPLMRLFLILALCSAACTVALFLFRHFYSAVSVAIVSLGLFIFVVAGAVRLVPKYAVFAGGQMVPIPEKDAGNGQLVASGTRVKIVAQAGSWVYIDCTDSGGWVPENSIYKIR